MTDEEIVKLLELFETRLNEQEAIIANLLVAYMEMWASVEMVLGVTLESRSAEEQEKFTEQFNNLRSQMLQSLKEASRSGLENLPPDLAESLANAARSKRGN